MSALSRRGLFGLLGSAAIAPMLPAVAPRPDLDYAAIEGLLKVWDEVKLAPTHITVTWRPIANAEGYRIYRRIPGEAEYLSAIVLDDPRADEVRLAP